MESKYRNRANEIMLSEVPTGCLINSNYVRGILDSMCQLAEEVKSTLFNTEQLVDILSAKDRQWKIKVEELLQQQRELSLLKVKELIEDNEGWDYSMCKATMENAKLKIN